MKTWHAPAAVLAIVAALAAAFAIGGPRAAMPVGAALILAVIVIAVRQKPTEAIRPPQAGDGLAHVLVVAAAPADDTETAQAIVDRIEEVRLASDDGEAEVVILAPARIGFADRWASDVSRARDRAKRNLVITVAALAKSGVEAEARVGDADIEQAVEDYLRDHPATDVIVVTGTAAEDSGGEKAYRDLRDRLTVPLTHIVAD